MLAIDSATLDLVEWLCRKVQWLTGKTNVWIAAQLTNLSIVIYFIWVATYIQVLPWFGRIAIGLFCGGLVYVLSQTVFKVSIETAEQNAYHRVAKGLRNPRRLRDAPLRISFLFLTVALFLFYRLLTISFSRLLAIHADLRSPFVLLGYPPVVLMTVVLYILACDPLPPCTSKVTEFLRSLALSRRPA